MRKSGAPNTVRFASVVERSGEPEVHTLWVAPAKDPALRRAEKEHRVMTIDRPGRGHADIGHVGFEPGTDVVRQYLIFPRSLARFAGDRIVGINFDRVAQPKLVPARVGKRPSARRRMADGKRSSKSKPPASARKENPAKPPARRAPERDSPIRREIRAAMQALEKGHSVAARRKLERLLADSALHRTADTEPSR
jgi:hypothetical protein